MEISDLTKLCSICYSEPPKYKCPRCYTATCSLPCYKKHQQRAVCNGKRDPSKYMKKSELATPAGIDHDYNYLKGLERSLERANEDVNGAETSNGVKAVQKGRLRGSPLEYYLKDHDITVEHPPKGMSRDLENRTRFSKSKKVAWTVEWIDADGNRDVRHDCVDDVSVGQLYNVHLAEKRNTAKRKLEGRSSQSQSQARKDEKRVHDASCGESGGSKRAKTTHATDSITLPANVTATSADTVAAVEDLEEQIPPLQAKAKPAIPEREAQEVGELSGRPGTDMNIWLDDGDVADSETLAESEDEADTTTESKSHRKRSRKHFEEADRYLYLHRPGTAASVKVLAPIDQSLSLTKLLRGRMVRGFPTIYALPNKPDALSNGFTLEKAYLKTRKAEDKELRKLIEEIPMDGDGLEEGEVEVPDGNSILDMLKRDVS